MKKKTAAMKQVQVRLPKQFLDQVRHIAKLADVTPTQVYRVLLALHLSKHQPSSQESRKP